METATSFIDGMKSRQVHFSLGKDLWCGFETVSCSGAPDAEVLEGAKFLASRLDFLQEAVHRHSSNLFRMELKAAPVPSCRKGIASI